MSNLAFHISNFVMNPITPEIQQNSLITTRIPQSFIVLPLTILSKNCQSSFLMWNSDNRWTELAAVGAGQRVRDLLPVFDNSGFTKLPPPASRIIKPQRNWWNAIKWPQDQKKNKLGNEFLNPLALDSCEKCLVSTTKKKLLTFRGLQLGEPFIFTLSLTTFYRSARDPRTVTRW